MRSLRHAAILAALASALTISGALANSLSPNKSFNVPTPNSDTNTWGNLLDVDITDLDTLLGGTVAVPITSTVQTATTGQASNLVQKLTGALSGNTTYELPQSLGGFWVIDNETTGSFSLTVATSALSSTGIIVPQGVHELVESDGTNVYEVAPGGLPPTGSASGDLGGSYPAPTVVSTHLAAPLPTAQGGIGGTSLSGAGASKVLISATAPVGAGTSSLTFTLPSGYAFWELDAVQWIPSVSGAWLELTMSTDGCSTFGASYQYQAIFSQNGTAGSSNNLSQGYIQFGFSEESTGGVAGNVLSQIFAGVTGGNPAVREDSSGSTPTGWIVGQFQGTSQSVTSVNCVKIVPSSGTFSAAGFYLYGMRAN